MGTRSLRWVAPAYHKKEGETSNLEHASIACSMTGDLMGALGSGLGGGKGGEVSDELRKRMIDVCCLLEVRWRGLGCFG